MWLPIVLLAVPVYLFAAWRLLAQGAAGVRVPWIGVLAAGLHALAIALTWRAGGAVVLGFPLAVSAVGLSLVLVFLALGTSRRIASLGTAIFPIAAFSLVVHGLLATGQDTHPDRAVTDWRILLHAALALLAFATLLMGALTSVMLGLQERALKTRRLQNWMDRVPPLTQVEALVFHLIGAGFGMLTLALVTGALFVQDLFAQHLAHKTVLSVLAWLVYGGLLLGRWRFGLRGMRAVRWTLLATVFLSLAFLGSKFVLEVLLQRP